MSENNFKDDLVKASRGKGFNPIIGSIFKKQQEWFNWFRSNVNNFHLFTQKINGIEKKFERRSLSLPKKICEDFVSLLWNEQCEIKIKSEKTRNIVNKVLEDNNFETEFGHLLELSLGVGMGYMIEYLENNITKIDFIPFEDGIPLAYDNGRVTALLTYNRTKIYNNDDEAYITHVVYHYMNNGQYIVEHETYYSEDESVLGYKQNSLLSQVFDDENIIDEFTVTHEVSKPFFQVIRPNIKNHFDIHSPHGVSIYSSALDYFRTADILFDAYETETQANKTRIVVNDKVLKTKFEVDDTGDARYVNYFDQDDTTFVAMNLGDEEKDAIHFLKGQFNYDQLENGIDKVIQLAGFRCGLGKNFYSFKDGNIYQNEKNVMTTNADTYKNKKKHEIILREVIENMINSILELERLAGRYSGNIEEEEIEIVFDDSIAIDDEAIEAKYLDLAEKGYIPKYMAVAQILKISSEEAKVYVLEAEQAEQERNKAYLDDYETDIEPTE